MLVAAPGLLDLSIQKTAVVTANFGDDLVYSITYRNAGGVTAENVRLIDILSISVTYVDFGYDRPISEVGSTSGSLIWDLGSLSSDEGGTIWVTVTVQPFFPS